MLTGFGQILNSTVLGLCVTNVCAQCLVVRIRCYLEKMVGNYQHFTEAEIVFFFSCKVIFITMARTQCM